MAQDEGLFAALEERLQVAEKLLKRCENLGTHVEGKQKLYKKIKAEFSFLSSLKRKETPIKASHVQCTNLSHLSGIVEAVDQSSGVVSVLTSFHYSWTDDDGSEGSGTCIVDIVASNGGVWIKVIARNPLALHRIWQGQGDYGERDITDQAKDFIECSKDHTIHFQNPVVIFHFCNGVTQSLATTLTEIHINVQGEVLADPEDSDPSISPVENIPTLVQQPFCINRVNLDVPSMIAYVSAVTNGGALFLFKDGIINSQAEQERHEPVLPKINEYLQGKELIACESAITRFEKLVQIIGGPSEKQRTRKLLERVQRVADDPSERALALTNSASIKLQSKIIFGTGDKMKAVTITANTAFVRAACSQGVNFSVFTHESRALTECKEKDATPITPQ